MQISKGVEWACHAVALMTALPSDRVLKADKLAQYHGVPTAYMAKQLQALSKAGVIHSSRGARGGYRLAKAPMDINLWDITAAIEGNKQAFRCSEIRQNGPCPASKPSCKNPCAIASSFHDAEMAFRASLRDVSLMKIATQVMQIKTAEEMAAMMQWIMNESIET